MFYKIKRCARPRARSREGGKQAGPPNMAGPQLEEWRLAWYTTIQRFEERPGRRPAVQAARLSEQSQWTEHSIPSLVGVYILGWEARYHVKWRMSADGTASIGKDIVALVRREGYVGAYQGIRAVFSDKMRWVQNHTGLLLSSDGFVRFVVPVIAMLAEEKAVGEQSEWRGDRGPIGREEVSF